MGIYRETDRVSIYCISDGEFVKIGRSKNVSNRLKSLQTSNARELFVQMIIPCRCPAQAIMRERQIHKSAKRHQLTGEWFTKDVMDNKYLLRYQRQADR